MTTQELQQLTQQKLQQYIQRKREALVFWSGLRGIREADAKVESLEREIREAEGMMG